MEYKAIKTLSDNPHLKKVFDFLVEAEPDDEIPVCDAIFIFGTSNGDVAKYAITLFHEKKASHIIISGMYGGISSEGPSGFGSEAEYFASIMEKEGVRSEAMILEARATNTYENVIFGMAACKKIGFYPKTLILVAVPYLCEGQRHVLQRIFPK